MGVSELESGVLAILVRQLSNLIYITEDRRWIGHQRLGWIVCERGKLCVTRNLVIAT